MAKPDNLLRNNNGSSFITSLVVISLVLFFLGLFSTSTLYSRLVLDQVLEMREMMVVLKNGTSEEEKNSLMAELEDKPWSKEVRYISKDEAARGFIDEVGEEFLTVMDGINPLPASINVRLNAEYANKDSVALMSLYFRDILEVSEVVYPIDQITQLRQNMTWLAIASGIVGIIVLLVAFFVIASTIRLSIYAQRLAIRSMQLIGARDNFIRWPFVKKGIIQGLLGGILAVGLLSALIFGIANLAEQFADLKLLFFEPLFMILIGGIVIFGALNGWFSSRIAVNRFLHRQMDELM